MDSFSLLSIVVLAVIAAFNVWTFLVYGFDKYRAGRSGARRVSERMLWSLALVGGSIGALAAMSVFRHKTRKTSFRIVLFLIVLVQAGLVATVLYYMAQR